MTGDPVRRTYELFAIPLGRAFSGRSLLFHIAAIVLTALFVLSGLDWWLYTATDYSGLISFAFGAAIVGLFLPVLAPVLLYIYGHARERRIAKVFAIALVQAAVLGLLVSASYKALTGRVPPEYRLSFSQSSPHDVSTDLSRSWNFGFMEAGVFDGWPSGHTTTAFAMATVTILLFRRYKWTVALAALYALYIGVGVGITIHWVSDFIAGSLIGIAIGRAVFEVHRRESVQ